MTAKNARRWATNITTYLMLHSFRRNGDTIVFFYCLFNNMTPDHSGDYSNSAKTMGESLLAGHWAEFVLSQEDHISFAWRMTVYRGAQIQQWQESCSIWCNMCRNDDRRALIWADLGKRSKTADEWIYWRQVIIKSSDQGFLTSVVNQL